MKAIKLGNWRRNKSLTDILVIVIILVLLSTLIAAIDISRLASNSNLTNSTKSLIETIIILSYLIIALIIFAVRKWWEFRLEIFKRKDLEKRMYKNRAELQAVLDGVPDLIMQVDKNMKILWANKAVLEQIPKAIGKRLSEAFSVIGESVIETYSKWAMVTGIIEKGIKYQPNIFGKESGSYWEAIGIPLKGKEGNIYGAIAIGRDVTERMRLEHTSNLLASIVESTDDAIYGMTYDSTILSWNLGAEKIYGYHNTEIIGNNALKTVLPEERPFFLKKIERVIRSQEITRFELTRIKNDNQKIIVSITLCPFVDATGRKIGVSAIDRDITKSKIAEKALKESETRYRELFENLSSGVSVFEPINNGKDFILKEFNKGAENIEKISKSKIIGKKLSDLLSELNMTQILDILKQVYKEKSYFQDILKIRENGKIKSWRDLKVYYLPSGEIVTIYDDITERIQAEEALINSEEKFRTLVSTAPDGIVLTDNKGIIIELNNAFAETFGYSRYNVIGKNFTDFFDTEFRKQRAIEILYNEPHKMLSKNEISAISQNGETIYIELSVAHLKNEDAKLTGMIVVTRDITLRKLYESELRDSREQMRSLAIHLQSAREEERKNIAFEIHDELGYALTAVKLDLAWMVKKLNLTDNHIIKKSKSMAELIDTTINKVRSISTQLRPSILDHFGLEAAIEWQANEFQKRTGIRCKLDLNIKSIEFKDPYRTAIFRIFQEALTNITRHAKASRVDVKFVELSDIIELKVNDNGVGMKGIQFGKTKSLGLIGMRERANSLGGTVEFFSDNGSGTSVVLKVPIDKFQKAEK